jgi:hypothetical protein
MLWARLILIFVGGFLLLNGLVRAWWEVVCWKTLAQIELAPATVDGRPHNVSLRGHILVAAIGLTIFVAGVMPW